MENTRYIDPEAKTPIRLKKMTDGNGNPYYIGKQQFSGDLNFKNGTSFMVFVSEEGVEELQIAPLSDNARKYHRNTERFNKNKFEIRLNSMVDANGKTYYVGEAVAPHSYDLNIGVFYTIFTSRPGHEILQISELKPREKKENTNEK